MTIGSNPVCQELAHFPPPISRSTSSIASGDFDSAEQRRRTILMAEWIIARLPFHRLALVEYDDQLTHDERQDAYRQWLRESARDD